MNRENSYGIIILQTLGIVLSQLLDFGTTMIGLKNGARESNGLIRMILEDYGTTGFLVSKIGFGLMFAWFCRYRPAAAWTIALVTSGVALWNVHILYQLV